MILYDDQAPHYDQRAGLSPEAAGQVAREVINLHGPDSNGVLMEIGVGTGQIGIELAHAVTHYAGFDHSIEMLRQFRNRAGRDENTPVFQADATGPWPVAAKGVQTFFGSRSLHHIPPEHFLSEALQLGEPTGFLVIQGAIRRKKESALEQLSVAMQEFLQAEGYSGHKRRQWKKRLLEVSSPHHPERLPDLIVASWPTLNTPLQSLQSWGSKRGLAGLDLPAPVKARVLEKTERWAVSRFGSLTQAIESVEEYELFGLKFSSKESSQHVFE